MNDRCKLLLWSCLCCLVAMRVQAQENGQGQPARHSHPPQDQFLHHLRAPPPDTFQPSDTVFCFTLGGAT
jgi:hypothetical protein